MYITIRNKSIHFKHIMSFVKTLQHLSLPRRSGKTVRLAMHYVQLVLDNPGKDVMVEDHHHTIAADRDLFGLVLDMLKTLRVEVRHNVSTMSITSIDGSFRPISYPSADLCLRAAADEEHENYRRRSPRNPNAIY